MSLFQNGRKKQFTSWSDDEDDDEFSDNEVNKIIIVTQLPSSRVKHEGYDRTGDWTTRTKITQELGSVISDGLFYYEQDLWRSNHGAVGRSLDAADRHRRQHKTVELISQEAFEMLSGDKPRKTGEQPPPPPPPPTYVESYLAEAALSSKCPSPDSCDPGPRT